MFSSELGTRLRLAREAKQLRQEDIAEACKVTQQAVQAWESGRSIPRGVQRIQALAATLGIEPAEIRSEGNKAAHSTLYETRRQVAESLGRIVNPPPVNASEMIARRTQQQYFEELNTGMLQALPDTLRKFANGVLDIKGNRYAFTYLSRKVVAAFMPTAMFRGSINILNVRQALYKMLVAERHFNDHPIPNHHYMIGVLFEGGDESLHSAAIGRMLATEAAMFGISLEIVESTENFARRVAELEDKPTELDLFYEQHKDLSDEIDVEFDEMVQRARIEDIL